MTISLDVLIAIATFIAIVGPCLFYMGKLSTRVENMEKTQDILKEDQDTIYTKLDSLRRELLDELRRHPVIRCPLHKDDKCSLRGLATDISGED